MYGLALATKTKGAQIFTHTHAKKFIEDERGITTTTSHGYKVRSSQLIMATNVPGKSCIAFFILPSIIIIIIHPKHFFQ